MNYDCNGSMKQKKNEESHKTVHLHATTRSFHSRSREIISVIHKFSVFIPLTRVCVHCDFYGGEALYRSFLVLIELSFLFRRLLLVIPSHSVSSSFSSSSSFFFFFAILIRCLHFQICDDFLFAFFVLFIVSRWDFVGF